MRPLLVRGVIALLHVVVGTLILCRTRVAQHGSWASCLAGVPALLTAGWALQAASPSWPLPAQMVFAAGGVLTAVSFLWLGRCFAILPAVRGTITGGPFRIVRHPAYLGEMVMIAACWMTVSGASQIGPLAAAIPFVVLRILAEERVLLTSAAYAEYVQQVRWRLIPLLW